jgi:hypothetical protein
MSKRIDVEISTTNKNLKGEDDKPLEIKVNCNAEVPETIQEAAEFYGGEDKLIESIQSDVARRKSNAARPILRDATSTLNWTTVAQQAIDTYQPGRRGGFGQPVTVDAAALASAGNMDELMALLRQSGVQFTNEQNDTTPSEEENNEEPVEGDEV